MALNLLALEGVLIDVLRAALPSNVKVGSVANLVGRQSVTELCPAVLVKPGASSIVEADTDPAVGDAVTVEEQIWTVIVLVQFVRDTAGLNADFSAAGNLMAQIYSALQGLSIETCRTFTYAGQQEPVPTEQGVVEFAVDFSVVRAFDPETT